MKIAWYRCYADRSVLYCILLMLTTDMDLFQKCIVLLWFKWIVAVQVVRCWALHQCLTEQYVQFIGGGTSASAPPPFRPGNPALCGSRPPVTPYYCRLGDLLCFVFMSAYCMFDLSVYYLFLQYFDTVGWVFWPVKTVSHLTYTVLVKT